MHVEDFDQSVISSVMQSVGHLSIPSSPTKEIQSTK